MNKLLSSKIIYDGKVIRVFFDELECDGKVIKREVVRHNGGCAVLAKNQGEFIFVKQYRHPFGEEFLELPAGMCEVGERVENTASRELEEECGLKPLKLTHICEFAVSPGYTNELLNLYYADEFLPSKQSFDEDESLTLVRIPIEKAIQMAKDGQIKDGKTLVALLWYIANFK